MWDLGAACYQSQDSRFSRSLGFRRAIGLKVFGNNFMEFFPDRGGAVDCHRLAKLLKMACKHHLFHRAAMNAVRTCASASCWSAMIQLGSPGW
jgi:hypothetical protein